MLREVSNSWRTDYTTGGVFGFEADLALALAAGFVADFAAAAPFVADPPAAFEPLAAPALGADFARVGDGLVTSAPGVDAFAGTVGAVAVGAPVSGAADVVLAGAAEAEGVLDAAEAEDPLAEPVDASVAAAS